ncbi:MAG: hypothetical protein CM15mP18_4290 [Methanobacteriota archaeon]|nr:MAG: hypothetical protein CM15mP18_4290 [Euryarchaeota archaeon]
MDARVAAMDVLRVNFPQPDADAKRLADGGRGRSFCPVLGRTQPRCWHGHDGCRWAWTVGGPRKPLWTLSTPTQASDENIHGSPGSPNATLCMWPSLKTPQRGPVPWWGHAMRWHHEANITGVVLMQIQAIDTGSPADCLALSCFDACS